MSTATELSRIQAARDTIRDKLVDFGLAQPTDKLDELADTIDDITNHGAVNATVTEGNAYTIPAGYHNGSGTVSGVSGGGNYTLQSKEVTPTKSRQEMTADSGYFGLSQISVLPIPDAYQNVSGVTATAADVLANKTIVTANGGTVAGTMADNGTVTATIDGLTVTSYTIPAGKHSGSGTVSLTGDIEAALAAI